jgi:hypothetical protein
VTTALVLASVLAVACDVLVALPFLREPEPPADRVEALDADTRRRLELAVARDRALEALRELESDHQAGRIEDADYRASVGRHRREGGQARRAQDG